MKRSIPNLPDERGGLLPVLPPGARLLMTARRITRCGPGRARLHRRGSLPDVNEIRTELLGSRARLQKGRSPVLQRACRSMDGVSWSVRCVLQDAGAARGPAPPRDWDASVSATCRLTAFLLEDWDDILQWLTSNDIERFRRHARRCPFDADVRRYLQIYLLLRMHVDRIPISDPTTRLARALARRERRRMQERLRGALRRLHRRLREAAARRG